MAMHGTAGVYINDAEDGLLHDYDAWLEKLAPHEPTAQWLKDQVSKTVALIGVWTMAEFQKQVNNGFLG